MRRLALLAVLTNGVPPAAAQGMTPALQPPPTEVECLSANVLSVVGIAREVLGAHESGRLSIQATLQNRTRRSAAFVINFNPPNVQMAAVNQWRTLEAQARGTYLLGTLPRGTLVSDQELRAHLQLRCVR